MQDDTEKIDDAVLALLFLTMRTEKHGIVRAWKSHDWDAMDRLYKKGDIFDPKSKSLSVVMTDEGATRAKGTVRNDVYQKVKIATYAHIKET